MGGLKEECGVIAVWTPDGDRAAESAFWGLMALQHRGQEAAGLAAWDGERIEVCKRLGLVHQALNERDLDTLPGGMAIGHVRYSTTGISSAANAGPLFYHTDRPVAVAHNGNLPGAVKLQRELTDGGLSFETSTDSELLAALLSRGPDLMDAARKMMQRVPGAFALAALGQGEMVACRDRWGIRPLLIGRLDHGYVVASETSALDLLEARFLREVLPGEVVRFSERGMESEQVLDSQARPCSFEPIYFARPDSRVAGQSVYSSRVALGRELAADYPADADLVIGVPDSGHLMALGYSQKAKIRFGEGLVKNRYVGRTFIEPSPQTRELALRRKFNTLTSAVVGQRLVVVDDSLVRGATMRQLVGMLRKAGAQEIHLRIASPATRFPCLYGIDMGRPGDYIALREDGSPRSVDEIAEILGADSLHFLNLAGLSRALKITLDNQCTACFSGDYPLPGEVGDKDGLA